MLCFLVLCCVLVIVWERGGGREVVWCVLVLVHGACWCVWCCVHGVSVGVHGVCGVCGMCARRVRVLVRGVVWGVVCARWWVVVPIFRENPTFHHPACNAQFPKDVQHCCHGMLVFRSFCDSHHKNAKVDRTKNFAPQT